MTGEPTADQRRFTRIPFATRTILVTEGQRLDSHLVDLSLKGALLTRPEGWQGGIGDRVTLQIELEGKGAPCITMAGRVAHVESGHIGCECLDIDVASISHLRRLMELNLGDASALERELSALMADIRPR